MTTTARTALYSLVTVLATTALAAAGPAKTSAKTALTRAKARAALADVEAKGTDCHDLALVGDPIPVTHLQDDKLQQTVASVQIAWFGTATKKLDGTVLATIVDKDANGALRGNHHIVTHDGTLRTERDVINLTPTDDKCIFNAKATIYYKDGTGVFAGYSGTGNAEATLDFCGGPGHAVVYGRLCK
jgi:hypothetical protein